MISYLHPDCRVEGLLSNLSHLRSELDAVSNDHDVLLSKYVEWTENFAKLTRNQFTSDAIERLIVTRSYQIISRAIVDTPDAALNKILYAEIQWQTDVLEKLREELRRWQARWALCNVTDFIVPDTNVLMEHKDLLDEIQWIAAAGLGPSSVPCVVIPLRVVEELDELKRKGQPEKKTRARHTLRIIEDTFVIKDANDGEVGTHASIPMQLKPMGPIWVDVLTTPLGHVRSQVSDDEIIVQASSLRPFVPAGGTLKLLSGDAAMRFQARSAGLNAKDLPDGWRRDWSAPKTKNDRQAQRRVPNQRLAMQDEVKIAADA